jgi:HK97 family phage portal protein
VILRTTAGDREHRAAEWGTSSVIPDAGAFLNWFSHAGEVVTEDTAVGLPAVLAAIWGIAGNISTLPMVVYRGDGTSREKARDSSQWELLHETPNDEVSPVDFYHDVAVGPEANGNSYLLKVKSTARADRRVVGLISIPPATVEVKRDRGTNQKIFEIQTGGGIERASIADVLHVRGPTLGDPLRGLSPIEIARNSLGTGLALERFEGKVFKNLPVLGGGLVVPGNLKRDKALEALRLFEQTHAGAENAGRPAILSGGTTWQQMGISLRDVQFIEAHAFTVEQVARMFTYPAWALDHSEQLETQASPEARAMFLVTFSLFKRIRRVESAFASDRDLFPRENVSEEERLFPEFLLDGFLRADIRSRYEAYRAARQAGWLTANEIRELENRAPHADGDQLQQTPVGGAPNQADGGGGSAAGNQEP